MDRTQRRGPTRLYAGLLTILVVAVVGVAASALYVSAGGEVLGWTAGRFGIQDRPDSVARTLDRARQAAWQSRFDDAVAAYDTVLSLRPGSPGVALERAKALAWAERYGEAADAMAAIGDTADSELALERARLLWWADRPREADSLLSVLLAADPDAREARELQDLIRPSVEPAVSVASRWVEERPTDPFSNLWLARALVQEGRAAESLRHYRAALGEAGTLEPEVLQEAAGVALGADSLRFAAEILSRYLNDVDPADRATRLRLARAYAWSGRWDRAEAEYRRVLDDQPDRAVRRELAGVLARAGRHADALEQLDTLIAEHEEERDLIERARVLALAERYGEAADALARLEASDDDAILLRRARYLWWAGRHVEADVAVTRLLERDPGNAEALALRAEVHAAIDPSVDLARQWLAAEDSPANRLLLARALVDADRPSESLEHYRAVLRAGVDRDLTVEAVGAAEAADSLGLAALLLESHMDATGVVDPGILLRLARVHAWSDNPEEASRRFAMYLALRPDDHGARFERAQQLAWQDSAHWGEARVELNRVVWADSTHAPALKLLGDLSRWEGDADVALVYYRRAAAADPELEGLDEGVRLAEAMKEAEAAPADVTRVAWAAEFSTYSDSESFDWISSGARYHWMVGGSTISAVVGQGWSGGRTLLGAELGSLGFSAGLAARLPLAGPEGRWHGLLEAGASSFDDASTVATWGAGLEYQDASSSATLRYRREPAVREAATLAALYAGAVLDRVQLSATRERGGWRSAADLQVQRFGADAGDATRFAGMARTDRAVGAGWTVGAMVRVIAADAAAPASTEMGPFYWAPRHYIAPALTVGWGRPLGSGWWLGVRAAPGYAWIDERENGVIRYEDGETPILETGATLGFRRGAWSVDVSGDWGGNLGDDAYNAATLGIRVSRFGGLR